MVIAICIVVFVVVTLLVTAFGYRAYARPVRVLSQLADVRKPSHTVEHIQFQPSDEPPAFDAKSLLQWIGGMMPLSPPDAAVNRKMLVAAGYRAEGALAVFAGIRIGVAVLFGALAAAFALSSEIQSALKVFSIAVGVAAGYWLPALALQEVLIPKYQEKLRFALPDALDMLVICVESGISLDQGLRIVSDELSMAHPELCRELSIVSVEMRAGLRRQQALKNLAQRTLEPELGKLVAMLIQTDRFGTSIADALRTHSDFMRIKRRQDAEERAGKLGVKLIFPIFFFILPAIFLVTVGPALINMRNTPLFGGN